MTTIQHTIENLTYIIEQLFRLNKEPAAKKLLEEVLEDNPTYSKAHYYLGLLYQNSFHQYQLAESHFRLAIKFGPPCPDAFLGLGKLLLDENRIKEAEGVVCQSLHFDGINLSESMELLGNIYEKAGKYKLARRHYKFALRKSLNSEFVNTQIDNLKRCRVKLYLF